MTPSMPLVSIICRSINRPELNQALESIAGQEYPSIEVVLVDALGKGSSIVPDLRQKLNLVEVSTGSQQDRSAAANLGLDNASGEFILFLDDDDFIAPAHISSLMEHFSKNQSAGVVYSSVRKVNKLGEELEEVLRVITTLFCYGEITIFRFMLFCFHDFCWEMGAVLMNL